MSHRDVLELTADDTDICSSFYHVQHNSGIAPAAPNCHCWLAGTGFHKYPLFWGFVSLKSVSNDFTIFLLPVTSHSTLLYMCDSCDIIELHIEVCSSKWRHLSVSSHHTNVGVCVSRFKPSQKLCICSLFIRETGLWKGFLKFMPVCMKSKTICHIYIF